MIKDHELRTLLHNEVHARPPEPLSTRVAVTHVVMLADETERQQSRVHLAQLMSDHHLAPPADGAAHVRADFGSFRLRWETHTEFVSWTFMRPMAPEELAPNAASSAVQAVPQAWLRALPGLGMVRLHVWIMPEPADAARLAVNSLLREDTLVSCRVANGLAEVHTDFQVHPDGHARMLLIHEPISERRLGRLVQQLCEIETYRLMALLALPTARAAVPLLARAEKELAELALAIQTAQRHEETHLLERLTRLASELEGQYAAQHSRFSASRAYFQLVDQRVSDIHESSIAGSQTMGEFLLRRISPARNTCESVSQRQIALSERVSRMSNLLRTRVDVEQERSSQELLQAMNRRQGLQLKLQSTVEGLSVAAISYYIVGLVKYMALGFESKGWIHDAEWLAAWFVPVVAGLVWWFMRRLHRRVLDRDAMTQPAQRP
ncbi:MAG: hypothetical protein RL307_744 [Pseudomonadota bacterium]|jgi:uncharacterized membrane-anchored protein